MATLQTWWNTPAAGFQTTVKNNVNSTANATLASTAPTTLTASENMSRTLEAKALRWVLTGGGNTSDADFVAVKDRLTNYATVTGGSALTSPLAARGYFVAFDLINGSLNTLERAAIVTRLDNNVKANLGFVPFDNSNQTVLNNSLRGFYAILAGNELDLDVATLRVRNGFSVASTNDGFFTDGDRYMNYFTPNLGAFMNSYVNQANDATGAAQMKNAAEQMATYVLGIRQPNGTSPSVHNSDNMPVAIHEYSRLIDDPDLKAAAVWYATQLNGHDWTSWSNATNNNWTLVDFMVLTDFSEGAAAPNWSPTYLAPGQSKAAVFKNDWSTTSNYLAMIGGTDGDGQAFTHHDTAAITVGSGGTQVIVEPGYQRSSGDSQLPNTPSGVGTHLDTSSATSHNVLLARTTGTSTWGQGSNANAQGLTLNNTTLTNRLDSQERGDFKGVMDFSTIKTTYLGVDDMGSGTQERRSIGMVNESATSNGYMVMSDSFRTLTTNKDFALNLIGKSRSTNTQIMTDNADYKKIRWSVNDYLGYDGTNRITSNNVNIPSGFPYNQSISGQVIAHIVASSNVAMDSVAQDEWWMNENYGSFIKTQRMRVSMTDTNGGAFLTLFELGAHNATSEWTVTSFSGSDHASARVVSTDGWTDWHISQTDSSGLLFTGPCGQVSIDGGALSSDAQYAYLREIDDMPDSAMISRGTNLYAQGEQLLSWSDPVTMSILFDDDDTLIEFRGTLSADGLESDSVLTIYDTTIFGDLDVASATLNGAAMSFTDQTVTMAGTGGGNFVITFASSFSSASLGGFSPAAASAPEPSTCTLILLAAAGLALYHRRRQRSP